MSYVWAMAALPERDPRYLTEVHKVINVRANENLVTDFKVACEAKGWSTSEALRWFMEETVKAWAKTKAPT
jgi:hypothetical protein